LDCRFLLQVCTIHISQLQVTVPPTYKNAKQHMPALNQAETSSSMPGDNFQLVWKSAPWWLVLVECDLENTPLHTFSFYSCSYKASWNWKIIQQIAGVTKWPLERLFLWPTQQFKSTADRTENGKLLKVNAKLIAVLEKLLLICIALWFIQKL